MIVTNIFAFHAVAFLIKSLSIAFLILAEDLTSKKKILYCLKVKNKQLIKITKHGTFTFLFGVFASYLTCKVIKPISLLSGRAL